MKNRALLLSVLALAVLAFLGSRPAQAQRCNQDTCQESNRCGMICGGSTPCNQECMDAGEVSTCGEYLGNPANDLDSDGIANSVDNCLCTSNSNQTDCDTDGIGDVCDAQNVKWVYQRYLGQCDYDADNSFGQIKIEVYAADQYVNVCDNSACFKKIELRHDRCLWSSSCGWSDSACCDCLTWQNGFNYCGNDNSCGTTQCPF